MKMVRLALVLSLVFAVFAVSETSADSVLLEQFESRLHDCIDRLPDLNAYEYALLYQRSNTVAEYISLLSETPLDRVLYADTLKLLDELDHQLTVRETEGWAHAKPENEGFILPPGCEDWQSNRPIYIQQPDNIDTDINSCTQEKGDTGSGWTGDRAIDTATGIKRRPALATLSDGTLISAISRETIGTNMNIALFESTDFGATWTFLTEYYVYADDCSYPSIAADVHTDTVYVVFQRDSQNNMGQIQGFSYSSGSVNGFTIDMDSGHDTKPRICCEYHHGSDNRLYVSYEHLTATNNGEVHVARSLDHGLTWFEWHNRGYGGNLDYHTKTDICVSNGDFVYLTYVKGPTSSGDKDLYVEYGNRSDSSSHFSNQVLVYDASENGDRGADHPAIIGSHADASRLIVVWERERPDDSHSAIYCAYTIIGGAVWEIAPISSDNDRFRRYPAVSVDGMGSSGTGISGDYYCAWYDMDDSSCRFKRASLMSPDSWSPWDDNTINNSNHYVPDFYRFGTITTQIRDDGNWYPCVGFTGANGNSALYTTKRAHPYQIEGNEPAYIVMVDGESYNMGSGSFNNWIQGSSHTVRAPDNPPHYWFNYWTDGGAQTHDIIATGGTTTETITAYFHNPTATPTNTPTPSPTPVCPYEQQCFIETHEDGDDWGEVSGPVWTQSSDEDCLVVNTSNPLDDGSDYIGRLNSGASVTVDIDTTGLTDIRLMLQMYNANFQATDYSYIYVSTDDGSTWIPVGLYSILFWSDIVLDLSNGYGPEVENNADVKIRVINTAVGSGKRVFIDNIVVLGCGSPTATPTQTPEPSMTPTATPTAYGHIIGERGVISGMTHEWYTVNLSNTYTDPVIILGEVTDNGNTIVATRVRNVTSSSFQCRLAEPVPCHNDIHSQEYVRYIVIESGQHELANGTVIEAGTLEIYDYIPASETIHFNTQFTDPPVVLAHVQTTNQDGFVTTRFADLPTSTSVDIAMDTPGEWLNCECDAHDAMEIMGWIAWPEDSGWNNGQIYEVTLSDSAVTSDESQVPFVNDYNQPVFVSSLQSRNDTDLCTLRNGGLTNLFIFMQISEDTCYDSETDHLEEETVGFIAMDFSGSIYGLTLQPTPSPTPDCINDGDVNGSGTLTAEDAQITFNIVLGFVVPTYEQSCAADCNGDTTITAADAQTIFLSVLGLDSCVE